MVAGVGVSWYTWLEQGRDINVSADVVEAVGRALQLSHAERTHLHLLAGLNPPADGAGGDPTVPAELRNVLDASSPRPAILRDMYWNVLGLNDATASTFGIDPDVDPRDRNCLIAFFTDDRYRGMHSAWAAAAPLVVAAFRADAAHHPGDDGFTRIVTRLSAVSEEFVRMWARHDVGVAAQSVKAIRHPDLGDLYFDTTTLRVVDHPRWFLELYNPRAA